MPRAFEILEHPADIGFRAFGRSRQELFENAALALFSLACDPATIEEQESRDVEATGSDDEALIYSWLAELLAVAETECLVFRRAVIRALDSGRVRGAAYGEAFDRNRHRSGTSIKAVTFHQLKVEPTRDGFCAQVFLDL